ncbi:MAG: S8 family serine peptidase [Nocardiopsaceae bacterium]|nr:S8 family serine peptidase [Nocardiopsaceae bacterium]
MTRRTRRLAAATAGLAAACALVLPAATAHAATGGYTPNPHEWWLNASHWDAQRNVWPITEGVGVTVAVVDSGVQASNPDLRGVVLPGGDMLGYPGNGEKDYAPKGGHGTAVAELIAGQGAGSSRVGADPVGIAPQAKILPVHVIDPSTNNAPIVKGIKYAVDHGASIINLSLGGNAPSSTTCDPDEQEAVAYALAHDVVVVAGSGDTNLRGPAPEEPGTCAGVLTVGGVEPNGSLWQDSVQGPQVSVAAPGDNIYTVNNNGQEYSTTGNGTSFSAPLVSGAAALIRSRYPKMPWYQVDQRLIDTAIPDGPQPNNSTGYGIINVTKALEASSYPVKASAPDPPYARYQAWLKTPAGQSFAKANHLSTGNPAGSGSGTHPGSSASGKPSSSGGGSGTLIVILVVVLVIAAIIALVIVLATRNRRGPRGPGAPGGGASGYPPGPYAPPSWYPPGQQYPPPGQYPQAPPGQQPPPGQYPPQQHP